MANNPQDIAIIGLSFRFPGCSNKEEYFNNFLNKVDSTSIASDDRWNTKTLEYYNFSTVGGFLDLKEWTHCDPSFYGANQSDTMFIDFHGKMMAKLAYEALEDSHMTNKIHGSNTGVFVGSHLSEHREMNLEFLNSLGSYQVFIPNNISYIYDLKGPSILINTACSSSLSSIDCAIKAIHDGSCDMALVGGIGSMVSPDFTITLGLAGVLAKNGKCKTFLESADGYGRGEGAAFVVLKKYSEAIADGDHIYSVIKGVHCNSDGSLGRPSKYSPSHLGQSSNITKALLKMCMDPKDIFYVETHGTGTPIGDHTETLALSNVFKESHKDTPLYIGCLKPNIGHSESSSGLSAVIKVCLMMRHRKLCPILNFDNPNPNIKFDEWNLRVVDQLMDFPADKTINIGINNFGIGGTNGFLVLSEHKQEKNLQIQKNQEIEYFVPISANSNESLEKFKSILTTKYFDFVKNSIPFKDFVRYQSIKLHFVQRTLIKASNWDEFKEMKIISSTETNLNSSIFLVMNSEKVPTIFCFSGQGPQWSGMGKELYESNMIFKDFVDKCDKNLMKYYGYSILEKLRNCQSETDEINTPILAQPSLFLIQSSLFELYKHWGVTPTVVLGHSFGEITAAYASGRIDLDAACFITYHRSICKIKLLVLAECCL